MFKFKKPLIIIILILVISGTLYIAWISLFIVVHEYGSPDELIAKSQIGEEIYFHPRYKSFNCVTDPVGSIECTWYYQDDPETKVFIQFPKNTNSSIPKISSASYVRAKVVSKQGKTATVLVLSVTDNIS